MTFVEAAIEVLKREGKPLDLRRLAELAVRHNLLSVVGRDPVGTMQERLDDALEKPDAKMPLFEVKKGTYGLRTYPDRPYPAGSEAKKANGHPKSEEAEEAGEEAEAAGEEAAPAAGGEAAAGGEKKKRRRGRRGGRGRRGRREGAAAAPGEETAGTEEGEELGAGAEGETEAETEVETAEAGAPEAETAAAPEAEAAPGEKRARQRSRRGGRGRRNVDKPAAEVEAGAEPHDDETPTGEHPVVRVQEPQIVGEEAAELVGEGAPESDEEAAVLAEPAAAPDDGLLTEEAELLDEEMGDEEDFDLPGGPLLAPSHGAEEVTRSEDERVVREEILGRRSDERGRRRGHERGRGRGRDREARAGQREGQRHEAPLRAHEAPRHEEKRHEEKRHEEKRHEEKRAEQPRAEAAPEKRGEKGNLIDVILEVLRSGDGRPMHVRAMADAALKRNLASGLGGHGDVVRQFRAALVREQRDREADGLRARVRALGGGHFAPADRKLDQELVPLERDLAQAAQKLRDATRSAVRRRVQRLPPPAFEALGCALLDKLGVTGVELVRRGDGVAYYGGQRQAGVATVKTLVAMRPGENELGRRAVGELRAGLAAKGYDEGMLLAAGRLNAEAVAELKNGAGVSAHDADSMSTLCLRHGLGVRRVQMPIDYLDLELFSELTEA